jgi:putative two-component system response regulator
MDRVYRPAFSHEEALEMIIAQRATAYDPDVVDCFARNHETLRAVRQRIAERRMTFADLVNAEHSIP